ncbi:MAG: PTS transporter subunit EIIC [Oscillospiraceae bacterium]|jgi:lactose/cellobiose-specific phosphotransferase system IIC component|nr:PTS transporter subunit EIIC [Oscillospiraceae bacterium]
MAPRKNPLEEQKINPVIAFFEMLSRNAFMTAVRGALTSMMPFMIIGAFALIINSFPSLAYNEFMVSVFGENWKNFMSRISNSTLNIMSLMLLIAVPYTLAETLNNRLEKKIGHRAGRVAAVIASLTAFFTLTNTDNNSVSFNSIGSQGILLAIVISSVSTYLYFFLYSHRIFKLKAVQGESDGSRYTRAIFSIEPCTIILILFSIIAEILTKLGITNIHDFFYDSLRKLFMSVDEAGLGSMLLFVFFTDLFWVFGVHGGNALGNIAFTLWYTERNENIAAVEQGLQPENIFTSDFVNSFIFVGGCGATLCLVIAILMFSRKSVSGSIAKASIPLAIFNINETVIFGLPIVFNPFYIIPFICVPLVFVLTTYAAMALGLVPLPIHAVGWTMPPFVSGVMATDSWSAVVLQAINIVIGVLIYMPFVRFSEDARVRRNIYMIERLTEEIEYVQTNRVPLLLTRHDEIGSLARSIANDLNYSINENHDLSLVFQPTGEQQRQTLRV